MPYHPYASGHQNDNIFNYCNPTYSIVGFESTCTNWKISDKYKRRGSDSWCNQNCNHSPSAKSRIIHLLIYPTYIEGITFLKNYTTLFLSF